MNLTEQIQAARTRQGSSVFVGEVQGYCDRSTCPARQVRIWCQVDVDDVVPCQAICPLCGNPLEIDQVQTFTEYHRDLDKERLDG